MTRLVIYTAVLGSIGDTLRTPAPQGRGVELVAFVDDPAAGELRGWRLRPSASGIAHARRSARWHKCHPHKLFPEARLTLWIDGVLTPAVDLLAPVVQAAELGELQVFKHAERRCLYQELEACLRLRKDDAATMRRQVERYRLEGYPHHHGLGETTAVLRRSCDRVVELNERWWEEIASGSLRDQLSFDYVCWRMGLKYRHLPGERTNCPWFRWRAHRGGPRRR